MANNPSLNTGYNLVPPPPSAEPLENTVSSAETTHDHATDVVDARTEVQRTLRSVPLPVEQYQAETTHGNVASDTTEVVTQSDAYPEIFDELHATGQRRHALRQSHIQNVLRTSGRAA